MIPCSYHSCTMGGGKAAVLLIALAVGYWVLTLAKKENAPLDKLGRFVGGLILAVSLIGLLCVAACGVMSMWCGRGGGMGCSPASMMCPAGGPKSATMKGACHSFMKGDSGEPAGEPAAEK